MRHSKPHGEPPVPSAARGSDPGPIVLATLNAKYIHSAFGLRYLLANMGSLRVRTRLIEFDINQRPLEIAETILAGQPCIVGFGVYIWNTDETLRVIAILKAIVPDLLIVLGGPEVSFESDRQEIVARADYVIAGEADFAFRELCERLVSGDRPESKTIQAFLPDCGTVALPYTEYTADDVSHRIIYVEASRGCPFTCEFCLSSLDVPVRQFPLKPFLAEMDGLLRRGVTQFKFVDRTFNLNLRTSAAILQFFLDRYRDGLFVHFEMIPDRLPDGLRELIARFPPGALQFEVGIQTFNETVSGLISRRQNYGRLADNLDYLRKHTGVHVHADLIVGLPGESIESFGAGFDALVSLNPQEIQVGILKRLRGTPISRHDQEWQMVYSESPPYEILQNRLLSFSELQRLRRFARFWDLVGNSGNFVETTALLWAIDRREGPFVRFMELSDWMHRRLGKQHGIALTRLVTLLFEFLTDVYRQSPTHVAPVLLRDYTRTGRSDIPVPLRPHIPGPAADPDSGRVRAIRSNRPGAGGNGIGAPPKRQNRHLSQSGNP